jgi:DNA-binding CsgD family transcriptional regulator/GAF domain-containing protein
VTITSSPGVPVRDQALASLTDLVGDDPALVRLQESEHDVNDVRRYAVSLMSRSTDSAIAVALSQVIVRIDAARRAELDRRFRLHSDQLATLDRVARAIDGSALDESGSVDRRAERMSQVVTHELCTSLGYGKAMFSVVRGSVWSPVALAVNPDLTQDFHDLITAIDGREISLRDAPREAELVRRRKSYAVDGVDTYRHTYRPLIDLSRPAGYLATPIVVGSRVVAIIHVDRQTDDLTDTDVHIAGTLAAMCAVTSERAQLHERVRARNDEVYAEVQRLTDELHRIESAGAWVSDPVETTAHPQSLSGFADRNTRAIPGADLLTAREHEVLTMMATGATNSAISRQLCISDGTVKSHVQRIFNKLNVSTRAEVAALCAHTIDSAGV